MDNLSVALPSDRPLLPYGLGRSYGDVCLTDVGTHLLTRSCRKIIEFDAAYGTLLCEAGTSIDEILAITVPQGWFPHVVPGTRFITVGGAIANDVHGKNHHIAGTFGNHVLEMEIKRTTGETLRCTPSLNGGLFGATVGGLGLTGLVTKARITLRPIVSTGMETETLPFGSIDEFLALSELASNRPYVAAWLDSLAPARKRGRGVLSVGGPVAAISRSEVQSPVSRPRQRRGIPFVAPSMLLNRWSGRMFNTAYRFRHRRRAASVMHYEAFLFPLDAIPRWNLLYGPRGLLQWQCVVPRADAVRTLDRILLAVADSGHETYLGVLKLFGDSISPGLLSFPRHGVTLALDFPIRGIQTFTFLNELDAIVADAGGGIYAAKDARMSPEMFRLSNPRLEEFVNFRDPGMRSRFWDRVVGGDGP